MKIFLLVLGIVAVGVVAALCLRKWLYGIGFVFGVMAEKIKEKTCELSDLLRSKRYPRIVRIGIKEGVDFEKFRKES